MAEHQLEFNGQTIETDAKGYLLNSSDWSEELAQVLADDDWSVGYHRLSFRQVRSICVNGSIDYGRFTANRFEYNRGPD